MNFVKGIAWGFVVLGGVVLALAYLVVMSSLLVHGHVILSALMAAVFVVLAFATIYHLERKQ